MNQKKIIAGNAELVVIHYLRYPLFMPLPHCNSDNRHDLVDGHELWPVDVSFSHRIQRGVEGRPRDSEDAMEPITII